MKFKRCEKRTEAFRGFKRKELKIFEKIPTNPKFLQAQEIIDYKCNDVKSIVTIFDISQTIFFDGDTITCIWQKQRYKNDFRNF